MKKAIWALMMFSSTILIAQSPAWDAPEDYMNRKNPVPSSGSTEEGKTLYQKFCSPCHGSNGKGDGPAAIALNPPPANHTTEKVRNETDGSLFWKISEGRGAMPAWKNTLSEEERWKIINFIRSLAPKGDTAGSIKINKSNIDSLTPDEDPAGCSSGCISVKEMGEKKFLATGSANTIGSFNTDSKDEFQFGFGFLPLFLWKPSEKLFFESHFHIEGGSAGGSGHSHGGNPSSKFSEASISIAYVNLVWFISKHLALSGGYFPAPIGIYNERMHPDWINKLPDAPLGTGHASSIIPPAELGLQLRGDFSVKWINCNYAVFTSNGPQIEYTTENAGKLLFGSVTDNNLNKALGGRIGVLPFYNSTIEFGFSGEIAKVGDAGTPYENLRSKIYAMDLSFTQTIRKLSGAVSLRSQFAHADVGNANYTVFPNARIVPSVQHAGTDTLSYYFVNTSHAGFVQLSFRPSLIKNRFFKNLELVGRFDEIQLPKEALWAMSDSRWAMGINYWLEQRSVIKFCYEIGEYRDLAMIQFVIGF